MSEVEKRISHGTSSRDDLAAARVSHHPADVEFEVQRMRERLCEGHVWKVGYVGATLNVEYCERCGAKRSAEGTAIRGR